MMEFALVLPTLLVLLYGLLETGRYLFIYASTITAARQAARYGSATGNNPDLVDTPYYNDCVGIDASARRVGFLNTFESVAISYDGGLDSFGNAIALSPQPVDPQCANFIPTGNTNRIIVTVTAKIYPIVPILPLKEWTVTSTSERIILTSVDIYVAPDPPDFNSAGDGKPYLITVVPDLSTYNAVDQVIQYTYNLRNSGLGNLVNPTIVDDKNTVSCGTITVVPAATFSCTGSHSITQTDLDAGLFKNKAYPTGWPSNAITTIVPATQQPAIALEKSGPMAARPRVGVVVPYSFKITNTGNVTLKVPFSVADNEIPNVNCSSATNIAPGAFTTCSGEDLVSSDDINHGLMFNQAIASVVFKTTTVSSDMSNWTVITPPILLEVSAPAVVSAPGEQTYTISLENNTDYPATNIELTTTPGLTINSPCDANIPSGGRVTCEGTYTFSQHEIDTHSSFDFSLSATGTINALEVYSNQYILKVEMLRAPALSASLVVTPPPPLVAGNTILYTYTLRNSGNVSLKSPIAVTDSLGKITITCADQSDFAPYSIGTPDRTCTSTYPVITADVEAGSIITNATASAKFSDGTDPDPDTIQATAINNTTFTYIGPRFKITAVQDKTTVTPDNLILKYTYTLKNTGSVALSRPYTITFTLKSTPVGGSATTNTFNLDSYSNCIKESIAPGESTDCTYTYTHESGTGSVALVNTVTAASINGTPASNPPGLPAALNANVYNCTAINFKVVYNSPNDYVVTWVITNNVGIKLTASNVIIGWSESLPQKLDTVGVTSGLAIRDPLPDSSSAYYLRGDINTGVTTLTFTFAKKNPTITERSVNIATPYSGCSR